MPIRCKHTLLPINEQEFHELDYKVMKYVFQAHRKYGRFFSEYHYKNFLVDNLPLKAIQWINFNSHTIEFTTLEK